MQVSEGSDTNYRVSEMPRQLRMNDLELSTMPRLTLPANYLFSTCSR